MVSTGLILSGGEEKNALSVFYSQFQWGRREHLSLSQRRVFSTLLTLWAPQRHWLWCGQTHPSPQVLHNASRRAVHHSDHLLTAEKINSEPKTPGHTWHHKNYCLDIPVQESLSQLTLCDWNKMHEAKRDPHNFWFCYHPSQLGSNLCIFPASLTLLQRKGFKASSNISHCSSPQPSDWVTYLSQEQLSKANTGIIPLN